MGEIIMSMRDARDDLSAQKNAKNTAQRELDHRKE